VCNDLVIPSKEEPDPTLIRKSRLLVTVDSFIDGSMLGAYVLFLDRRRHSMPDIDQQKRQIRMVE